MLVCVNRGTPNKREEHVALLQLAKGTNPKKHAQIQILRQDLLAWGWVGQWPAHVGSFLFSCHENVRQPAEALRMTSRCTDSTRRGHPRLRHWACLQMRRPLLGGSRLIQRGRQPLRGVPNFETSPYWLFGILGRLHILAIVASAQNWTYLGPEVQECLWCLAWPLNEFKQAASCFAEVLASG